MNKIIDSIVQVALMGCILYGTYTIGYTLAKQDMAINEPQSPYFWIDNDRFAKNSEIYPTPLYNELGEIIGSMVMIRNDRGDTFKEFLDSEKGSWKIDRDSWLIAFREGSI